MRLDVKTAGNDRVGVAPRNGWSGFSRNLRSAFTCAATCENGAADGSAGPAGFIQHDVHASAVYLAGSKRLNSLHHEVEDAAEDGRANTVLWALRSS
jgi:hypothetical protein